MKTKITTYALVTVTLRIGVEHDSDVDGEGLMESLEVKKVETMEGKIISLDTVNVDEVDIVECEEEN